jgi:hypothetical protein
MNLHVKYTYLSNVRILHVTCVFQPTLIHINLGDKSKKIRWSKKIKCLIKIYLEIVTLLMTLWS